MSNQGSELISCHMIARMKWEVDEFQRMAERYSSVIQYVRHGTTFSILLFVPSIRYAKPEFLALYYAGSMISLGCQYITDNDLELVGAEEPIKMAMKLQIAQAGVQQPLFRVLSPLFHPHILCGSLCIGQDSWRVDRAAAWTLPYVMDMLTMQPGTYQLFSDAFNPSASVYFSRNIIPFGLPLVGDRYYGQQQES